MRARQSLSKRLAIPPVPAVGFPASERLQSRRRIWFELCDRPVLRVWRRRLQQPAGLSTVGRHDHFLPRLSKAALFILGGGASSCLPRVLPPRPQRHHCRIELANTAEQLNFQAIPNHRPFPKARRASWMSSVVRLHLSVWSESLCWHCSHHTRYSLLIFLALPYGRWRRTKLRYAAGCLLVASGPVQVFVTLRQTFVRCCD